MKHNLILRMKFNLVTQQTCAVVSTYDYNIQYTCSLSIGIQFILENISRADINYRPDIRAITGQHVNTRISQLPMFLLCHEPNIDQMT